jgi:signal transduction histidine kinase
MPETVNILLVDDEVRNLDVLESILENPSYRLLRADNADLALKLLLEHDVAAIVLDIKMPGVSGFELAQLIKGTKKFRQIPIVFLTAYLIEEKDIITGYGTGAVDYLTKPVNPAILRHKIAVFADLFRKTRALADLNEKLEARVKERTAALEHANRMKDEFLATVSHELRTPLQAILGWAIVMTRNPTPEKFRRGLEVIERNVRAQERLVTDLLDVSRIVAGKLRLNMQKFPLSNAIHAAADVVRHAAEAKGVRLTLDLDPLVGQIVGDPERMQQIMWNLLVNAIRHTPEGGRVVVTAQRTGSLNMVRVEDTGSGIPAEHLPHIFERFRQVDGSISRAHGGLGLGLSLVRHFVEAHGGSVEAKSDGAGRGASFTLTLPVLAVDLQEGDGAGADAKAEDQGGSSPSSSLTATDLADVRVLVVEDDPDSLEIVRVVLEEAGAEVTCAADGRQALALLDDRRAYDVIISDIGMPEIDGYELIQRIRSGSHRGIPVIALTAYARGEEVERVKKAGFLKHLAKPVDSRELVDSVKAVAPSKRLPKPVSSPRA